MKMTQMTMPVVLCTTLLLAAACSAAPMIYDDFEVNSSANYIIMDDGNAPSGTGTPDSEAEFAYNYIAAGLPLAPNSTAGDKGGLRFAVNESSDGDPSLQEDHITAFYNAPVTSKAYTVQVDMYMFVESGASGTTEMSTIGIGSDGTDFNSIFTPIAGDGHFVAITGEGGSSSDYRHFVEGTPVASGDPSYLNSTNTTNATGDTYQDLFPNSEFPGSPGNQWVTVSISVNPSRVVYAIDGTPIIETPTVDSEGLVGIGYMDPFDSVGPHFVVYDNLSVTIPEPATWSLAFLALGGLLLRARRS